MIKTRKFPSNNTPASHLLFARLTESLKKSSNSKDRALGSPSDSLDHRRLCYCLWLIGGGFSEKKSTFRIYGFGVLVANN